MVKSVLYFRLTCFLIVHAYFGNELRFNYRMLVFRSRILERVRQTFNH
jgi:hypothetical protein